MKNLNYQNESKLLNPFEKAISKIGDRLTEIPFEPRCWGWLIYEPQIPDDVINNYLHTN